MRIIKFVLKFNLRSVILYLYKLSDLLISGLSMYILYIFLPSNIWIISERANCASDNGIIFFKYLNEKHGQLKSYYILDKNSPCIEQVNAIGRVLIRNSFKHKLLFLKCAVIATTEKGIIEPWGCNLYYHFFSFMFPKKLRIFLQHGVSDKDVSYVYGKNVSYFDLFVCSSVREKNFIENTFGYSSHEVVNTGMPRFDKLKFMFREKENIILLAPTWRKYLSHADYNEYEFFLKSDYFVQLDKILNDRNLHELLKKHSFRLIMTTHHGVKNFSKHFKSKSELIQIQTIDDSNISDLLMRSRIFITDYSSLHFDAAYCGNINLYFQHDIEQFMNEHAGQSYFSYKRDGFGKVAKDSDELIENIKLILENKQNFTIYENRAEKFFTYKDDKNCERLYELVSMNLKKEYKGRLL